jgi:TfoX/Sxy family transcriptional regulator of competence genes
VKQYNPENLSCQLPRGWGLYLKLAGHKKGKFMKWQKSPQDLIDLFTSVMPGPPAVQRNMFGYPAGFINGHIFMGLFQDDMILRLPEGQREEFLKKVGSKIFEPMPGRPMREYVAVPPRLLVDPKELVRCILEAREYGDAEAISRKIQKMVTNKKRSAFTKKRK